MRFAIALALFACAPDAPPSGVTVPASGYQSVEFHLDDLDVTATDVTRASIGGVAALIEDAPTAGSLRLLVQGHPDPGPHDLVLHSGDGRAHTLPDAVTYTAPDPAIGRIAAIGASVTMGFRAGAFDGDAALTSPPALVAHTLGAWFPVPLTAPGVIFEGEATQIEAPDCLSLNYRTHFGDILTASAEALANPDGPGLVMGRARRDPDLQSHNLAVAATAIAELSGGVNRTVVAKRVYSQLIHAPFEPIDGGVGEPQLDVLDRIEPDIVLGFDLLANDIADAILEPDGLDVSQARSFSVVEPAFIAAMDRLEATGAEVFLATMPLMSQVPLTHDAAHRSRARGVPEDEIQAELEAIDALVERANALLLREASRRPRVHVVDIAAAVHGLPDLTARYGLPPLTTERFAGIPGLDGIHFTRTGNAIAAALTLEVMADVLGIDPTLPDFDAIYRADTEQPAALAEQGLPEACLP